MKKQADITGNNRDPELKVIKGITNTVIPDETPALMQELRRVFNLHQFKKPVVAFSNESRLKLFVKRLSDIVLSQMPL